MIFLTSKFLTRTVLLSAILSAGLMAGCSETKTIDAKVDEAQAKANSALSQIAPKNRLAQTLEIDSRPYYGGAAIPIANGSALPPQFEQNDAIVMTFARGVSLHEFARMVQSVTGIRTNTNGNAPVSASGTIDDSASGFLPSDGEQVSGGRIVWQGRLSDLLNQASDTFKADWRYENSAITFAQEVTRTFMLHSLASELSITGSVASGSGGGGSAASSLPEVNVTSTSSLKVWDEIKEAVATIMGDGGQAAFSPSTGTITVTGAPDVVRRVESYLSQQNSMRLRRVAIAVKVMSVTLTNEEDFETDITGIIKRAFGEASAILEPSTGGGLAFTIRKDKTQAVDADRMIAILSAEKNVERVATEHSGALMTLSDQPAPLQVGRQITYLARTSSSSGDSGSGSVSLEPGTIDEGLMMTVLPRIVEQNKILMRVSVAITALANIETFGEAGNQIQLPEVDTTGFLQNAVLTSGETLILAGFERDHNGRTVGGAPGALQALKASRGTERSRDVKILMLTADILPEEPMTVIGN